MSMLKRHYEVLGLKNFATIKEVKKAYRRKAFECHPDRNLHDPEGASEEFHLISGAHTILGKKDSKKSYDRDLKKELRNHLNYFGDESPDIPDSEPSDEEEGDEFDYGSFLNEHLHKPKKRPRESDEEQDYRWDKADDTWFQEDDEEADLDEDPALWEEEEKLAARRRKFAKVETSPSPKKKAPSPEKADVKPLEKPDSDDEEEGLLSEDDPLETGQEGELDDESEGRLSDEDNEEEILTRRRAKFATPSSPKETKKAAARWPKETRKAADRWREDGETRGKRCRKVGGGDESAQDSWLDQPLDAMDL